MGQDAVGVVNLNIATNRGEYVGVNPIVGVRYRPIEDKVEEWSGEKALTVVGTTITTPLGYVTPNQTYMEWSFRPGTDTAAEIAQIMRSIQDYGLPFMMKHSTLAAVTKALEEGHFTYNDSRRYRLPVAYLLQGKSQLAVQMVNEELSRLETRVDGAAQDYRKFAERFLKEVERTALA